MSELPTSPSDFEPRAKWGDALDTGFQVVPDALLKYQVRLGLSPFDVVLLLNITTHWWMAADLPYPRLSTLAERMGTSPRTVERRVAALEKTGLLRRLPKERNAKGLSIRRFDLGGLAAQLAELARRDPTYGMRRKAAA